MTRVDIVDLADALVVKTERTPPLLEGVVSAVATAGASGLLGSTVFGRVGAIVIAVLAGTLSFLFTRRMRRFELRLTESEFSAIGRIGDNLGNSRSVATSDIQWLEYQDDTSGPETGHHPGGLYAQLAHRAVCLLPNIEEEQTWSVVARIHDKYPALRTRWAANSPFGKNFPSLGLLDEPR